MSRVLLSALAVIFTVPNAPFVSPAPGADMHEAPERLWAGDIEFVLGEGVYREDFDSGEPAVWVEGNPDRVFIDRGRLIMDANDVEERVLTVFVDRKFQGDLYFEYDVEILRSDTASGFPEPRDVNNLNTFLYYSDPSGHDLKKTRESRSDGAYRHYHELNGYIVTFLNGYIVERRERENDPSRKITLSENTGRFRLRENPGFFLMNEAFMERSGAGRVYRMQFVYSEGELFCFIDNEFHLSFRPSEERRVEEGYFAFRTFATEIAVDQLTVREVSRGSSG